MSSVKWYYPEIIVFMAIFGVLLICNLPGMTWINTDSDGAHYILSAKYMGVAHNTSAPLYLLLGRLFLFIPLGSDAWRMGLISVLATTICAIYIYKSVRHHHDNRLYALIASLIYGGSALVISQSTIIETYALSTMLMVMSYYYSLQSRWLLTSVLIGMVAAIHPLFFVMAWIVLVVANKELRNKKYVVVSFSFIIFYLYIPITKALSDVPAMWGNSSFAGFFQNNFGTMWMLAGGLSLYDLPKRIIDTISILSVSMGLGIVCVVVYAVMKRTWRNALLWLFLIPVVYFVINLSAETYVYMIPSIAFGAIITGIVLSKLNRKIVYATGLVAVILFVYNANYFDIGRTLDPNLSAQRFYDEELPKVRDGDIYMGSGWTWAIVYLYNKEENRNIIPVCTDILPSKEYRDMLSEKGINYIPTDSDSMIDKQWAVAKSIVELNDNVWIAKETIPSEFQYEIVPARDNLYLIDRWLGYEITPQIAWKPSNPYAYITGALEVSEWKFILKTNHNVRFAIVWCVYALGFYWLTERLFRRKRNVASKEKTEIR